MNQDPIDQYKVESNVVFFCVWLGFTVFCAGVWAVLIWLLA